MLFSVNCILQAGIPDGVINVVPGFGPTAGAAITSHMDVESVSDWSFVLHIILAISQNSHATYVPCIPFLSALIPHQNTVVSGCFHWLCWSRSPHHGVSCTEQPEDSLAWARWQVASDNLRRRWCRHGSQPVKACHFLQQGNAPWNRGSGSSEFCLEQQNRPYLTATGVWISGRGLRCRVACLCSGGDLRWVRQEGCGGCPELESWRSFRCFHQHGSPGIFILFFFTNISVEKRAMGVR